MSYQFKVGDKGKMQNGSNYEVIGVEPRAVAGNQLIVLIGGAVNVDKYVTSRHLDGKYFKTEDSNYDLMPPIKTVWDVSFERINALGTSDDRPTPISTTHTYANEKDARKMFENFTSNGYHNILKNVTLTSREVQAE